jgi:DNA-binding MarR family transcriptional regulator
MGHVVKMKQKREVQPLPEPTEWYPKNPRLANFDQTLKGHADSRLTDNERVILDHLIIRCSRNGYCFLKQKTLALETCRSKSAVNRAIKSLIELDYIRIEKIPNRFSFVMLGHELIPEAPKNRDREITKRLEAQVFG